MKKLVLIILLLGLSGPLSSKPRKKRIDFKDKKAPSTLIITFTSLNKGFLQAYGAQKSSMPFLDSLAAKSLIFDNAFNGTSWRNISRMVAKLFKPRFLKTHNLEARGENLEHWAFMKEAKSKKKDIIKSKFKVKVHRYEKKNDIIATFKKYYSDIERKPFVSHLHFKTNHIPYIKALKKNEIPKEVLEYLEKTKNFKNRIPFLLSLLDEKIVLPMLGKKLVEVAKNKFGVREISRQSFLLLQNKENIEKWKSSPQFKEDMRILKKFYAQSLKEADEYLKILLGEIIQYQKQHPLYIFIMGAHGEAFLESGSLGHSGHITDSETAIPLIIYRSTKRTQGRYQQQFHDNYVRYLIHKIYFNHKKFKGAKFRTNIDEIQNENDFIPLSNCQADLIGVRYKNKYKLIYEVKKDRFSYIDLKSDPYEKSPIYNIPKTDEFNRIREYLNEYLIETASYTRFKTLAEDDYCLIRD